jgi:uroporphyrinogen III methyltransferase/synthase
LSRTSGETSTEPRYGTVYLVGSGPGDDGLLTLRAAELLARADVVVYDYLVDSSILARCAKTARRIDVGKRPNRPTNQDEINELLVGLAAQHEVVVRLKGGDPFVFGRGGEEAEVLLTRGVPFVVVPGVSSAIAVPAYGGTPVTHRGESSGFVVVTGHAQRGGHLDLNWNALCGLDMTIVVLMGVAHRAEIASELQAAGMDPATPVLAVTWGTTPRQSTVRTTLSALGDSEIQSPAVLVIGGSAGVELDWFSPPELAGLRVVVTRGDAEEDRLARGLRALGAEIISCPMFEIVEPSDGGRALERAIATVSSYDWIIFSSVNAVKRFLGRVDDLRALGSTKVAAIGRSTAREVERFRVGVDLVPPEAVGESLAELFPAGPGRVLFPRAEVAREVVPTALRTKGWEVDVVGAYRNSPVQLGPDEIDERVYDPEVVVTFTSASSVHSFVSSYDPSLVRGTIAVIGPITKAAAEAEGLAVTIEAKTHDNEGLVEAIRAWCSDHSSLNLARAPGL